MIHLPLLLAMSMEYIVCGMNSVVEMRENHDVVVLLKKLLMAGDKEFNPGHYPPGMLIF